MKLPKSAELWLGPYLSNRAKRFRAQPPARRLWVAHTDHFEPMGGKASIETGRARMAAWHERWPSIAAAAPRDATGRPPCFTFFYPQEEYVPEILDSVAELTRDGTTDVEVHIHHFDDTAAGLTAKLTEFTEQLHRDHGLLHIHDGKLVFGFIHGNWALDNSHPSGCCCGVTGELQILRDLGCYADFTMPSLPSPTQARIVNQIYWTTGDPTQPRGFDQGIQATEGAGRQGDLLMITGPLGLRYRERLVPRLEMGEIAANDPATPYRVKRWIDLAPRIGEDIFVKLFGHSAREDNAAALLGTAETQGSLASLYQWMAEEAKEQELELHWVSAYEMFRAVDRLVSPAATSEAMANVQVTSAC